MMNEFAFEEWVYLVLGMAINVDLDTVSGFYGSKFRTVSIPKCYSLLMLLFLRGGGIF